MLSIGVITTSYPRFAGDPAGSFVGAHVAAMRALGHTVEVIAAGDTHDDVTRVPSRLFYGAGAPDELERSPSLVGAVTFTARLTAQVIRRAHRWDLIVAHWLAPSALAALPTRAPLLAIAHGGDVHTLRRARLLRPALYALRARNARLAFVSSELLAIARAAAPRLAAWLDAASIVQPMGIDVSHFARLARAPVKPPTILVAARLVPVKGVDVAVDAVAHVRTPSCLVIAGDGPERDALASRARQPAANGYHPTDHRTPAPETGYHPTDHRTRGGRATEPRTRLVGSVDAAERDRLLGEASVVVVPSRVLANGRTEGMPMIALEALAAGVPVIASAVGGLRELAPSVELVPPEDPPALAAAIDRVLAAPPRRIDVADLDWPRVAARLLAHAALRP